MTSAGARDTNSAHSSAPAQAADHRGRAAWASPVVEILDHLTLESEPA